MLAVSLVLFQDGMVGDFLRLRGPLLPADERDLVAGWALVERSVHEVTAMSHGAGVTLRDVRTGQEVDVREPLGSPPSVVGDLVCAHVVPDGVGRQIVGGVAPVAPHAGDHLLATLDAKVGAVEVAAAIAAGSTP
jgi:hypothetical protein